MTPFMKKELTNILYIHNNLDDFYKFVPQCILPKDYGGEELECVEFRGSKYLFCYNIYILDQVI